MPLKPRHKAITQREDIREGKPLDASEFAVHLDGVRDGTAPAHYQKARQVLHSYGPNGETLQSSKADLSETKVARVDTTGLDRIHQSMILFGAGRGEALKRFLVEDGAGITTLLASSPGAFSLVSEHYGREALGGLRCWRERKDYDF